MDGNHFDTIIRAAVQSRRSVLGSALAAVLGVMSQTGSEAKKRRKRCKSPRVKCGKKCLRAGSCCTSADCDPCQTCSGTRCVVAPSGTACGVGGECNGTACIREGAFGCPADQNFCDTGARTPCPRSATPGAICVAIDSGKTVCATGGCVDRGTQQTCEASLGTGAVQMEFCAECALQAPSEDGCFRPVTR